MHVFKAEWRIGALQLDWLQSLLFFFCSYLPKKKKILSGKNFLSGPTVEFLTCRGDYIQCIQKKGSSKSQVRIIHLCQNSKPGARLLYNVLNKFLQFLGLNCIICWMKRKQADSI